MLFLIVLFIALGWAGWLWAWGRDRYTSVSGLGLPPSPFAAPPASRLSAPRNQNGARQRRREVLGSAVVAFFLCLLLARSWAPMWLPTVGSLAFLVWYGAAVYRIEVGNGESVVPSLQQRFGPVLEDGPSATETSQIRPPLQRLE